MMMCSDLWGFMMICRDLWGFMMICSDLWGFVMMCGDLWGCVVVYGDFDAFWGRFTHGRCVFLRFYVTQSGWNNDNYMWLYQWRITNYRLHMPKILGIPHGGWVILSPKLHKHHPTTRFLSLYLHPIRHQISWLQGVPWHGNSSCYLATLQ